MNQLPRRERRRLERERKRQRRNLKRKIRRQTRPPAQKKPMASIAGAMRAKQKAEEHIETLKIKLVELQTKSVHSTGRQSLLRRNIIFDTIDRIHKRIKQTEDLIEVYNEWVKRERMIKKLGEEAKKHAPK